MGGKYCSSSRVAIRKLSTSSRRIVTLARTYICVLRIFIFILIFILNKNDTFGFVRGIENSTLRVTLVLQITWYIILIL